MGLVALCLVLARAQGQTVTPQRPPWCQQCQQYRCQYCESWWTHALLSHPWDMLGVTGETEAGQACDLLCYPEEGFGRTTRPSWLWRKVGHSLQRGIARARPCSWCGAHTWWHMHVQPGPACPAVSPGVWARVQPAPPTRACACDSPAPGQQRPNGDWHCRFPGGTGKGGCSAGNRGGPRCRLGAAGVLCTWGGNGVSCTALRHGHAGLNWGAVCCVGGTVY